MSLYLKTQSLFLKKKVTDGDSYSKERTNRKGTFLKKKDRGTFSEQKWWNGDLFRKILIVWSKRAIGRILYHIKRPDRRNFLRKLMGRSLIPKRNTDRVEQESNRVKTFSYRKRPNMRRFLKKGNFSRRLTGWGGEVIRQIYFFEKKIKGLVFFFRKLWRRKLFWD